MSHHDEAGRFLADLQQIPPQRVPIDSLKLYLSPRIAGEDDDHVQVLANARESLPPIIVHSPTMRVIDGMHRVRAARLRGEESVLVKFFEGDEASSFVLAVKTNVAHGLPLTLADRKAAAARIITLYPQWSDRMVASITGIAGKTVGAVRASLWQQSVARPSENNSQLDATVGLDGRRRPRDRSEGRLLVRKLLEEDPSASLRKIAHLAGVSPETVRSERMAIAREVVATDNDATGGPGAAEQAPLRNPTRKLAGPRAGRAELSGTEALEALKADPAFRSTERGRGILRILIGSVLVMTKAELLIDSIPSHCLGWLAVAAAENARGWGEFAATVKRRRDI